MQTNETRPLSLTGYKSQIKWIEELNMRSEQLEENIKEILSDVGTRKNYLEKIPKHRSKHRKLGLHKTKSLLQTKGNNWQSEETTYNMMGNICKLYI
jgi:hypothetical protein